MYRNTYLTDLRVLKVTPEMATQMLAKNEDNRKVNDKRVSAYASIMLNGGWMATGQPIIVSKEGMLIDGQHRLNAVVRAGVAVDFLVVTLDAKDGEGELTAREIPIDIGQKRTISNITGLGTLEAAVARLIMWQFENTQALTTDPEQVMIVFNKIERFYNLLPKYKVTYFTSAPILATLIVMYANGYTDGYEMYKNIVTKNYHLLNSIGSSFIRSIESTRLLVGVERAKMQIAITWRLQKSTGERIVVRDVEKEVAECAEAYKNIFIKGAK